MARDSKGLRAKSTRTKRDSPKEPVTVATIARESGVSASSVSRVLSGKGYASKETRERVLRTASELGYLPNRVAQSLRLRQTKTLGLIIADVENSFYSRIAKEVETVAKEAGYHVILCNTSDDPTEERHYLDLLAGLQVDGICITPTSGNSNTLKQLIARNLPIVQIDRRIESLGADSVLVDNAAGAYLAVNHLIQFGHRRIGILAGSLHVTTGQQRLRGYERAHRENHLEVEPRLIQSGSFRRDVAADAVRALLDTPPRPTAVFAANNVLAELCMLALHERGMRVPDDMSVVAFDDELWMRMIYRPLTVVAQPTIHMARIAASQLLRRLTERGSTETVSIVLDPTLQIRDSVAPPAQEEVVAIT